MNPIRPYMASISTSFYVDLIIDFDDKEAEKLYRELREAFMEHARIDDLLKEVGYSGPVVISAFSESRIVQGKNKVLVHLSIDGIER